MKWPWQKQKPEPMTKQQLASLFVQVLQECAAPSPSTQRLYELCAQVDGVPKEFIRKHANYINQQIGKSAQADPGVTERIRRNTQALKARLDQGSASSTDAQPS